MNDPNFQIIKMKVKHEISELCISIPSRYHSYHAHIEFRVLYQTGVLKT